MQANAIAAPKVPCTSYWKEYTFSSALQGSEAIRDTGRDIDIVPTSPKIKKKEGKKYFLYD